jgi:hypothetical protein
MQDTYKDISFNFKVDLCCMFKEDSFTPNETHSEEIIKWYKNNIGELKELSITVMEINFHFVKDNIYRCNYKLRAWESYTENMFIKLHTNITDPDPYLFHTIEYNDINYIPIGTLIDKDIPFLKEKELIEKISKITIKNL